MEFKNCPEILRNYLYYILTIKGRSKNTANTYFVDLKNFLHYIYYYKNNVNKQLLIEEIKSTDIENLDVEFFRHITLSDVYEYLNYILPTNNGKSRARKVSCIRSFFKYLTNTIHLLEINPVEDLDSPNYKKSLPKYLSLEESTILLDAALETTNTRDYCIVTFFLNCGIRLSELVGINKYDIKDDTLRILGKGNKERILFLNKACINAYEKYIVDRIKLKGKKIGRASCRERV